VLRAPQSARRVVASMFVLKAAVGAAKTALPTAVPVRYSDFVAALVAVMAVEDLAESATRVFDVRAGFHICFLVSSAHWLPSTMRG
jgi:hypothetical protein